MAERPHRVLRSSVEAAEAFEGEVVGGVELAGQTMPVPRLSVIAPGRHSTGAIEAVSLYAGQSVNAVREIKPVNEVVQELTSAT